MGITHANRSISFPHHSYFPSPTFYFLSLFFVLSLFLVIFIFPSSFLILSSFVFYRSISFPHLSFSYLSLLHFISLRSLSLCLCFPSFLFFPLPSSFYFSSLSIALSLSPIFFIFPLSSAFHFLSISIRSVHRVQPYYCCSAHVHIIHIKKKCSFSSTTPPIPHPPPYL